MTRISTDTLRERLTNVAHIMMRASGIADPKVRLLLLEIASEINEGKASTEPATFKAFDLDDPRR